MRLDIILELARLAAEYAAAKAEREAELIREAGIPAGGIVAGDLKEKRYEVEIELPEEAELGAL
ncbi:MAG: hypothetical protein IJP49_06300 [Bacteroidales bacterium]|nr:hypothetical protein [Bacteroidales bacterium]